MLTGTATSEETRLIYGVVAEFETPEALVAAAEKARAEGYRKMEAYSPFPIHGLTEALEFWDPRIFIIVFIAGCTGALAGAGLEYFTSVIDYPMNVGGRPYLSWPSFFPVVYECTILFSAFGAVLGMLGLNGLPRPYHSIFNAPNFERATIDRFFLCIEAKDRRFDLGETVRFLEGMNPLAVSEVEE